MIYAWNESSDRFDFNKAIRAFVWDTVQGVVLIHFIQYKFNSDTVVEYKF